jgi:UDP-N-acetylglucosamine--N-acetylmuramyl-(pentapeptide) pyrophosphoryl-undecaprenol N-acetylglucosamine transferase
LDEARRALGLSPDLPTLLVFGGSKGARSINRALLAVLPQLLGDMQVVHVSGRLDWPDVQKSRDALVSDHDMAPEIVARYHAYPYLHAEMGAALTAADLAVARAGASTLGEFPIFGLPAILVPYPHAWRYQMVNARYLESHGAALILEDAALGEDLFATIKTLMDDPSRRTQMKQAMHSLAKPDAAQSIASMLGELALATSPERI